MAAVMQQTQTQTRTRMRTHTARVTAVPSIPSLRPARPPIQTQTRVAQPRQLRAPSPESEYVSPTSSSELVTAASAHGGRTSLALFLTNIKLLDLDRLPDWPDISADTFATAGSHVSGQKKRVQSVEWVLFQLFAIWDPAETASKLKPFFPPLDQLQSVNLRSALVRCLEQAKKNGLLGRDAVIRKTMLDECRGERLEEILAYFSTAVLKKEVSEDIFTEDEHVPPALQMAFENKGYKADKSELTAMSIAHKKALRKLLDRKEVAKSRFRDFSELLDHKERQIVQRQEAIVAKQLSSSGQSVSDNARAEMRRALRNNWSGNEMWMESLLRGDAKNLGLLNTPFDKVWRRVQQGRLAELEASGTGLLEHLETRVRVQKERLHKWNAFRRDMFGATKATPSRSRAAAAGKTKGIDLGFGEHADLQVNRMTRLKPSPFAREPQMTDDYVSLVSDLKYELGKITNKNVDIKALLSQLMPAKKDTRASTSSFEGVGDDDSISDLEDAESVFRSEVPMTSFQDKLAGANGPTIRPRLSRPSLTQGSGPFSGTEQRNFPGKSRYDLGQLDDSPPPAPPPHQRQPSISESPSRRPISVETKAHSPPRRASKSPGEISPTQDPADEMETMNTSPYQMKRTRPRHTLSLAERTRLSLTRKKSLLFEDGELDPLPSRVVPIEEETESKPTEPEPVEDLISRTRRSMAGFEKAQQKAQLERRRSQRRSKIPPQRQGSYFHKVDEDTLETTRLIEQLAEEEDMEAVFKSRPKIKESQFPSPTKNRPW